MWMTIGRRAGHCAATTWILAAAIAALGTLPALAEPGSDATSSRAARNEAIRTIPWKRLAEPDRARIQSIVTDATIYRRLPTRVIDCDPDLFTFLLRHPDVVVDVWRVMGVSNVTLDRVSPETFRGTDGAGTTGNLHYAFTQWGRDAHNLAVVYAEGAYDGTPFPKPLRAESVLVLKSGAVQETNGRHYITVRLDSFVRVEQTGVDLVARTLQPFINKTADRNLIETLGFVSTFSRTAERNPQGMQRLAARLECVDAPTRDELVHLCYRTAQRYAAGGSAKWAKPYVLAQQVELPAPKPAK
jgi:hypothetical protein